jgi:hypothetical protein
LANGNYLGKPAKATCLSLNNTAMALRLKRKNRSRASAFTILEAVFALAIAALAGSVLLLGTTTSLETTKNDLYGAVALGMAQQLMDEISGCIYFESGGNPYSTVLGPDSGETTSGTRLSYDDSDDFNGLRCKPPKDYNGIVLGKDDGAGGQRNSLFQAPSGMMNNWQQEVDVYYVSGTDLSTRLGMGQTSDYRVVEVRITYADPALGTRPLATLKRVLSYAPPMQ